MSRGKKMESTYLNKILLFTHLLGLAGGILFPIAARPLIGEQVFRLEFIGLCLLFGYLIAVCSYLFVRSR